MLNTPLGGSVAVDLELPGKPVGRMLPTSLPLWLVGMYLGLYIIRPWELLFPDLASINFERVYALGMIAVVLATIGFRLDFNAHSAALLAFIASLIAATMFGYGLDQSIDTLYKYLPVTISFLLIAAVARTTYDVVFLVSCYVGFMGLYLAKSVWEYHVHGARVFAMGVTRMAGIETSYGNPNGVAASTMIVFPYLHCLWNIRHQVTCCWTPFAARLLTGGLVLSAALSLWAVNLTNSRTGFIALIVYFVLASLQDWRRALPRLVLLMVVATVCWQFLPEENKGRFRTIWDPGAGPSNAQASAESREEGFLVGMQIFEQHPILGVGPGNFTPYRRAHIDGINLEAHNLPGQLCAELGVVGAIAFSMIGVTIVTSSRQTRSVLQSRNSAEAVVLRALAKANLMSLLMLCIVSLSGHTLYRPNWLWTSCFAMLVAELACNVREIDTLQG